MLNELTVIRNHLFEFKILQIAGDALSRKKSIDFDIRDLPVQLCVRLLQGTNFPIAFFHKG